MDPRKAAHVPGSTPLGLRHLSVEGQCAWTECEQPYSPRYPISLCQTHALLIWSLVDSDIAEAGRPLESQDVPAILRDSAEVGWVYYVQIGDKIKVGYTSDLQKRIGQYPPDSKLLASRPGTLKDERDIHSLLTARRAAGREWYLMCDEVIDHIAAVVSLYGKPPKVRDWTRPNTQAARLGLKSGVL